MNSQTNVSPDRPKRTQLIIDKLIDLSQILQKHNEALAQVCNNTRDIENSLQGRDEDPSTGMDELAKIPSQEKDFDSCNFYEKLELITTRMNNLLDQYSANISVCESSINRIRTEL